MRFHIILILWFIGYLNKSAGSILAPGRFRTPQVQSLVCTISLISCRPAYNKALQFSTLQLYRVSRRMKGWKDSKKIDEYFLATYGLIIRPVNSMVFDVFSLMVKKNGLSAITVLRDGPTDVSSIPIEVTAAASVPDSSIPRNVFCFTKLTRIRASAIPPNSA